MSRYTEDRQMIVSAAQRAAANAICLRHTGGADCFSIPVTADGEPVLASEADDHVTHYSTGNWRMPRPLRATIEAEITALGGEIESQASGTQKQRFQAALSARFKQCECDRHKFAFVAVIHKADRNAIHTWLVGLGYANAATKFFQTGLSDTGSLPVDAWADRWKLDQSFIASIKHLADTWPRSYIGFWPRANAGNGDMDWLRAHALGGDDYKSNDWQTRSHARVRITNNKPTTQQVLDWIAANSNPPMSLQVIP